MCAQNSTDMSLEDDDIRQRLSAPAFRAFVDTAKYLGLETEETLQLLNVSAATYDHYRIQVADDLGRDVLERISLVLGVTIALRQIFTNDEAGRQWLRARNREPVFAGRSPLAVMQGSIADLYRVRAHLDGWRQGP